MADQPNRQELEQLRAELIAKIVSVKDMTAMSQSAPELNTIEAALKHIEELLLEAED